MSEPPDQYYNLSTGLSEVLNEIGVNENIVQRRRKAWMLRETISTIWCSLTGSFNKVFHFGSQTEGSTTPGLDSDLDTLTCLSDIQVIQDLSQWQPDKSKLLMVQDETTSPGYCLLQGMREDEPVPLMRQDPRPDLDPYEFLTDDNGRVLVQNFVPLIDGGIRRGPAETQEGRDDIIDEDNVVGFCCSSWPKEAEP
jgi:hypothetical protein